MFADDLKLYKRVASQEDCLLLQHDLNRLSNWCIINRLDLNISKCKIMTFSRKKTIINYSYSLQDSPLIRVSTVVDLGLLMDPKLNFNDHICLKISKAKSMLGFVKRVTTDFNDINALKSLYFCLVRSILEYAAVVWSPFYESSIIKIESVQRNFTRYALWKSGWRGDHQPYNTRLQKLNMITLQKRRRIYSALTTADIITSKIDSSYLLGKINFKVNRFSGSLRTQNVLNLKSAKTNYGSYEPINNLCRVFNEYSHLFDYNLNKKQFKDLLFTA